MLKKRIAASLVVKDGIVVQSYNFGRYLPVGIPSIAIEFLNQWGIDEIIFLDISASRNNTNPDYKLIRDASRKCFVPLTVGGGIRSVSQISDLMHCGADKIAINQAAVNNPGLISQAAHIFGNQCIVVSIDAKKVDHEYRIFDYINRTVIDIRPEVFARQAEEAGAGEILINSVDRDGTFEGYDIELINSICESVKIPVICCGGAKNALDIHNVFQNTNVCAANAANFYHFTEHSVITSKAFLVQHNEIRSETFADYRDSSFNKDMRLIKKPDGILEDMLFVRIEKEVI